MSAATVELTLRFPRDLKYLHLATQVSRLACGAIPDLSLPQGFADEVELAVSEACTNAFRHVTDVDASAMLIVRFEVNEKQLVIDVGDQGPGFELEEVPQPEFDRHPEQGYGLYIIRKMMDEVRYVKGGELNTLIMKKAFGKKERVGMDTERDHG